MLIRKWQCNLDIIKCTETNRHPESVGCGYVSGKVRCDKCAREMPEQHHMMLRAIKQGWLILFDGRVAKCPDCRKK